MSYSTLLNEENINAQYLVVVKPARRVTSWTLHSGSVYYSDFSLGYVSSVTENGAEYTAGASASLSASQFYYDEQAGRLYARTSGGGSPSAQFMVVTYELYFGTFDAHFYRDPTDNTTDEVYWDPLIERTPILKSSVSDVELGFLPTSRTGITLNNAEHIFEKHLYDSSFKNKDILVYHWLDDLETGNIKLILRGMMGNISYSKSRLTIEILDPVTVFDNEFRFGTNNFYNTTLYTDLDPNKFGKPIRYVYGMVDGFVPINLDYVETEPTTSDNRIFGIRTDGANLANLTKTVGGGTHTTTKTFLTSTLGLQIGDSVHFDRAAGTDEYFNITNVTSTFIEHAALVTEMVDGDTVKRGTVGAVEIKQGEVIYKPQFARDWTESVDGNDVLKLTFSSSLEANLSMAETFKPSDDIICRVYGKQNNVTKDGDPFGTNDTSYNTLTDISVILFDLMVNFIGISEDDIDLDSFDDLQSDVDHAVGFSVPEGVNDKFPKYKDLVLKLLQTGLIKIYRDFDLKWKVSHTKPITTTSKSIEDDEVLSFEYDFDYSDIFSDFTVKYFLKEKQFGESDKGYQGVGSTSDVATYLHEINRAMEVETYHLKTSEAQSTCDRYSYIFGDHRGTLSIETKNRFFNNIIDDDIEVSSNKMPGFDFDEETVRDREFSLIEVDKSLRSVKITLSDQKGIQDNEGDW